MVTIVSVILWIYEYIGHFVKWELVTRVLVTGGVILVSFQAFFRKKY